MSPKATQFESSMTICICGWYFNEILLDRLASEDWLGMYDVFMIAHRPHDRDQWVKSKVYPNVGLEFGAYDQYLQNHWNGVSDVLFIQDDTVVNDEDAFAQIADLSKKSIHQAFIFSNEWEEIGNKGKHGRAIWCSAQFLTQLKKDGGFPYDRSNTGQLSGPSVNDGIEAFTRYVNQQPGAGYICIVPGLVFGRRGVIPQGSYVYHRKTREGAQLIPGGNGALVIGAQNVI